MSIFKIFENSILKKINVVLHIFSMCLFMGMTICVLLQVIFRYAIPIPTPWTEEAARFLFIWATFMGAAYAFSTGEHLNVKILLTNISSDKLRGLILSIADCLCFWFLGTYVVKGFTLTSMLLEVGQTPPSMDFLQMGWVYYAIPLGSLLMIINLLPNFANHLSMIFGVKGDEK